MIRTGTLLGVQNGSPFFVVGARSELVRGQDAPSCGDRLDVARELLFDRGYRPGHVEQEHRRRRRAGSPRANCERPSRTRRRPRWLFFLRTPAVSIRTKVSPSRSMITSTASRVVPGISETITRSSWASVVDQRRLAGIAAADDGHLQGGCRTGRRVHRPGIEPGARSARAAFSGTRPDRFRSAR